MYFFLENEVGYKESQGKNMFKNSLQKIRDCWGIPGNSIRRPWIFIDRRHAKKIKQNEYTNILNLV